MSIKVIFVFSVKIQLNISYRMFRCFSTLSVEIPAKTFLVSPFGYGAKINLGSVTSNEKNEIRIEIFHHQRFLRQCDNEK